MGKAKKEGRLAASTLVSWNGQTQSARRQEVDQGGRWGDGKDG